MCELWHSFRWYAKELIEGMCLAWKYDIELAIDFIDSDMYFSWKTKPFVLYDHNTQDTKENNYSSGKVQITLV